MKKASFLLLYVPLLLALSGFSWAAEKGQREPSLPAVREFYYEFILHNTTNHDLKNVEFWTYGPVKSTSSQKCLELEASQPHKLILDGLGNRILHFRFASLPPYAICPITIRATVEFADAPDQNGPNDFQQFVSAAEYVESDDAELRRFAVSLRGRSTEETAHNIFRWVSDNIVYSGYLRDNRGAFYAFKNKRGDCTEYMFLFAALCRANGIPARGMSGYVCRENGILEPEAYHNWAEFYDGGVWKIADPQRRVFAQEASQYVAMRIIGSSSNNPMGTFHRYRCSIDQVEVTMTSQSNHQGT